jgi:hypothetical protein
MHLFPELESRRAMLIFLGTHLGMKGGCQPNRFALDFLRPLLNKLHELSAAYAKLLLALLDADQEHAGALPSTGVALMQLTSTSSQASLLSSMALLASRAHCKPQQRADALFKEVHSLF